MRYLGPILACLCLLAVSPASARLWNVAANGTGDAPTIQAGIDSSQAGDTVVLGSGVFTGEGNRNISFKGKAIQVLSLAGVGSTVIDCEGNAAGGPFARRGFTFNNGETSDAVLSGVTIRNGREIHGGGIRIVDSSPTILSVVILDCEATSTGGGIQIQGGGSPTITSCLISNCAATGSQTGLGGGIAVDGGSGGVPSPTIGSCEIAGNRAGRQGGGIHVSASNAGPSIVSNRIQANTATEEGGGIYLGLTIRADLIGNQVFANTAESGGGIYFDGTTGSSTVTVNTNTIAENTGSLSGAGVFFNMCSFDFERCLVAFNTGSAGISCNGGNHRVVCSVVHGNDGGDEICTGGDDNQNSTEDPEFCGEPDSRNYFLQSDSPAAPEHSACGQQIGALPVNCDTTPVEPTTWGRIKSEFQ